ncbi:AAA family ATPase [Solwaraspora sp. WMMD1047]|uniref:AAA family ATPase n=1 Tax=Solwaraspora sp. WMMD1047 TaxID=3016102 RepID=UPI00241695D7|nr:AAA family ATPase [Solwaraspora sp. WMMD1047]MDG4827860.1 AAA family ATPase [Solwaraspora sp. WMMD1047]
MTWDPVYQGNGVVRPGVALPPPPPWRTFPRKSLGGKFQPPPGLVSAVNAALFLRRPLLITGSPGSGKSTVIESVAEELDLGPVLRWHITSRSSLTEALYRYDVLGRIHARQLGSDTDDISPFLQFGPLGTALLPAARPRALLIDEIDKSDLDLPSDLLDVLERGEFEIPELARYERATVAVRGWDSNQLHGITRGRVACTQFPVIVMTDNGEREFAAPFLRRCIRYTMPVHTDIEVVKRAVRAHLEGVDVESEPIVELIEQFVARTRSGDLLALDQLLNAVFVVIGGAAPVGYQRDQVMKYLLRELSGA